MRGIAIVNAGITIATLITLMNVQFEHEVTMKEQEKELAERHIDIMLSQIQPHFLYNSLGAIYHLCENESGGSKESNKEVLRISARKYGKPEEPWADCFCLGVKPCDQLLVSGTTALWR